MENTLLAMTGKTQSTINFNRYRIFGTLITDASGVYVSSLHQDSITMPFQEKKKAAMDQLLALFGKADIFILYVAG